MHTQVEHVWSFDEMIGQIGSDIAFSKPRERNCCNIKISHIYSLLSGLCVWRSSAVIIIGLLLLFSANYLLQIFGVSRNIFGRSRRRERTSEVLWTLNSNGWRSFNHRLPSLISLGLSESWVFSGDFIINKFSLEYTNEHEMINLESARRLLIQVAWERDEGPRHTQNERRGSIEAQDSIGQRGKGHKKKIDSKKRRGEVQEQKTDTSWNLSLDMV